MEAARKALQIDESIVESHVEMGSVYTFYDFDWAGAEREFKRAIELNPKYAPAHEYYGWYLVTVGRVSEALAESRSPNRSILPRWKSASFRHGGSISRAAMTER
jgi:Tfp pilus assembly protein PilF